MNENQKKFMNDFHKLCEKYNINDVVIEKDMDGEPIIAFHSNGEIFYFKEYVSPAPVSNVKDAGFYNIQHKIPYYFIDCCEEEK
jgi:hypothetical protein